jgi:hypothetical protein
MYFVLPKSVHILSKINLHDFEDYFITGILYVLGTKLEFYIEL